MALKLRYYGDPALRQRAAEVGEVTDEIRELVNQMWKVFDEHPAVGLAANQVGVLKRVFLVRHDEYLPNGEVIRGEPLTYIDPKLSHPSEETWMFNEPCLSLPGLRVPIERPMRITIEATNLKGERFTEELTEYDARVRMHENDHLNGVLIVDRTSKSARRQIEDKLRKIKKKYSK